MADINLLSSEIRDLGKLALELGGITETVSVTSEVTPVQVADSSRRSTITVDDLANIQMKGRDVFGLLAILPGVQDTNLNRDFAQWRSAISITINGMPSQNKDVRVDGLNIVDEGGCGTAFVNLNMDAIGEVQVIANGYTAENGRNNGGLISVVTKSGGSVLKASGWYNGRRDQFNENDYFRKAAGQAKPLYRVNISGYGVGGPVVIPGLVDSRSGKGGSKKFYFFLSQEYTDDARPTTTSRANMPTALEYERRFLADPGDGWNHSADHRSDYLACSSPGTSSRLIASTRSGRRCFACCRKPTASSTRASDQQWTSNSTYDLTPVHGRTNHVLRADGVLTDKTRFNVKIVKDRDDDWSWNRITPGTGFVNQNTPGLLMSTTVTKILKPTIVNETNFGYTHNRWGFKAADDFDYTSLYRSTLGIDPPRFEPFAEYNDPPELGGFGASQLDEWPYAPRFSTTGGNRSNLGNFRVGNGNIQSADEPIPRLNLSGRFVFNNDLSMTWGRHNIKMGVAMEYNRKTEPGSADYMGNFDFGHNANNPAEHRQRLREHAARRLHDLHRADGPRGSRRAALAERLLRPGQLAYHAATDRGLRYTHSAQRVGLRSQQHEQRLLHRCSGVAATQRGSTAWYARMAVRAITACPANLQRTIDPANPNVFLSTAFNGNIVQGTGSQINGITTGGIPGRKPGTYFTFPYFTYAPRAGFAWNMFGDGKTALRGSWGIFYNFPRSTGDGGYAVLRWLSGIVHAPDPLGDVQRHHDGDGGKPDRKPRQREHRRLRTAALEIAQREPGVPARHRLQHRCRNSLCRKLHVEPRTNGRCQPACRFTCTAIRPTW